MTTPLASLIASGTKLWLDSIDPDLVRENRAAGATGATSNPIIIADLIRSGRFDQRLFDLHRQGLDDEQIAWRLTDSLVSDAQQVFLPVWRDTGGDDGYVSFELDPLLEDPDQGFDDAQRQRRYVELGNQWSAGHQNRMIKTPATPAGLASLEQLVADGVTVNVTLIFTQRQARQAREAVWRGAQRAARREAVKSVYSVFVSRIDVYTAKHVPELGPAQGEVGAANAKRIWRENHDFWADKGLPLAQEIIFASTGVKNPDDPPWKYVEALAGDDIQTNPPATNEAVESSGRRFARRLDEPIPEEVSADIAAHVDQQRLESTLMAEGVRKFAEPHHRLLELIAEKRAALAAG